MSDLKFWIATIKQRKSKPYYSFKIKVAMENLSPRSEELSRSTSGSCRWYRRNLQPQPASAHNINVPYTAATNFPLSSMHCYRPNSPWWQFQLTVYANMFPENQANSLQFEIDTIIPQPTPLFKGFLITEYLLLEYSWRSVDLRMPFAPLSKIKT